MEITEVGIVQVGVNIEIRITVNGMKFYSHYGFENEKEAREILKAYGLKETEGSL